MPEGSDQPVAARAAAFIGTSRWLRRPQRMLRYDARWPDGRVEYDVSLVKTMYRGWPADFAPIDEAVHAHCPELGIGAWVGENGWVFEGPVRDDPHAPTDVRRRPAKYRAVKREPNPTAQLAWRLAGALGVLGGGVWLVTTAGDGVLGWVGVLCSLGGAAGLTNLVPRLRRWWR
jgi:hypothetical protein